MTSQGRDRGYERERDELRRNGLEHDPRADHEHELELADRLADQASLPPATLPPVRSPATGSAAAPARTGSRTSPSRSASPAVSG